MRGTGELCLERGLWDTGRPPRVSSLARARGALLGRSTLSSASRGIIEKKSEISSERADAENSRGPPSEATRDSEQTKNELGPREPRSEGTASLVDKGSKVAEGGTSAAEPGTGETDTSENSSERAAGGRGDSTAEDESSNLAANCVSDVSVTKKRKSEEDAQISAMSNGDAKILKTAAKEGEAHVPQKPKLNGVESSDITDKSATEEVGAEEKERLPPVSMRLAVVPERFPDDRMTEEQAEVLVTALVEQIDPTAKGDPVQFSATQYENGGLVLTCVNQATKGWLHKTVPKISPWPGARLAVGQAETTLKGTKYILWLMNGMHKRSNQQIITFFQKQNNDISTAEWKIIKRVSESETRQRIILWVDDKSSEDLKAHDFKLFLGLTRSNFLLWSEWKKQTAGNVPAKRSAVQNSARPSTGPGFSRFPVPARGRSRGRGFSGANPRPQIYRFDRLQRELEFADTGARHFRGAQSTASGRLSPRERGIGISERSQFRESGYAPSDREMHRDTMYSAGRPQGNCYFPPELRQSRDAGYGDADRLRLRGMRFIDLDRFSPRETRYTASDRAPARDSRYTPPNGNQLEKPMSRDSYQTLSRNSRFRDLDERPSRGSRFRGSDQMQSREGSFVEQNPLYSRRESGSRISHSRQLGEYDSTISRAPPSTGDLFSGSDDPSQQFRSSYTNSTHSRFSRPSESSRAKW